MKRARQVSFDTQGDDFMRVPSDIKKTTINR